MLPVHFSFLYKTRQRDLPVLTEGRMHIQPRVGFPLDSRRAVVVVMIVFFLLFFFRKKTITVQVSKRPLSVAFLHRGGCAIEISAGSRGGAACWSVSSS